MTIEKVMALRRLMPACPERAIVRVWVVGVVCLAMTLIWFLTSSSSPLQTPLLGANGGMLHSVNRPSSVQAQRQEHLSRWCKKHGYPEATNQAIIGTLIVDDVHKVIYCPIQKVASTNWRKTLAQLALKDKFTNLTAGKGVHCPSFLRVAGLKNMHHYRRSQQFFRLKTYFKFMFVRHPLERLLSAYRNKLDKNNKDYDKKYRKLTMAKMGKGKSWRYSDSRGEVTFTEFLKYVGKEAQKGRSLDRHWATYTSRCQPCRIKYDFIGKFETMVEDSNYIVNRIQGGAGSLLFPLRNNFRNPPSKTVMAAYYEQVPRETVDLITSVFSKDFDLFNYTRN